MKEDTFKPEEDGTNGERRNAQHLLQDSSLAESERENRVKSEEENGQILVGRNEEGERKPGGALKFGWLSLSTVLSCVPIPLQARIGEDRL